MGKPVSQVAEDIEEGRNIMNYFSGLVELTHGETSLNTPNHLNMMVRQPFGVVAAIVPWNFPTTLVSTQVPCTKATFVNKVQACHEIGPACGAGNALILKVGRVPAYLKSPVC
jgi:aldehyde dehydrogenase (NAD+)